MDLRSLTYCIDQITGTYVSLQATIGQKGADPDEYIKLLKHGGAGGECQQWDLGEDDWITLIEISFDWFSGNVQRIRLFTSLGDDRAVGYTTGIFVAANYAYDHYKQFVGFLSYEIDDVTKAFGSYDSFCNQLSYPVTDITDGEFAEFQEFEGEISSG